MSPQQDDSLTERDKYNLYELKMYKSGHVVFYIRIFILGESEIIFIRLSLQNSR